MTSTSSTVIYRRSPIWNSLGRLAAAVFFASMGLFSCAISAALVPRILAGLGFMSPTPGPNTMSLGRLIVGVGACGGLGLVLLFVPARWLLDLLSVPATLEGPLERKHSSTYLSQKGSRMVTRKLFIEGQDFDVNEATFDAVREGMPLRAELDRWSRTLRRLDHLG